MIKLTPICLDVLSTDQQRQAKLATFLQKKKKILCIKTGAINLLNFIVSLSKYLCFTQTTFFVITEKSSC